MRSFIFNSDIKYRDKILFFCFISITLYLIMNSVAFLGNKNITEHDRKTTLMKEMFTDEKPDIVFIGSSTTKYHVSTNIFKNDNIRIFNYGVESHFFTAYPSMIDNAIKLKPKVIAISVHAPELYFPLMSIDPAFNKEVNVTNENLRFFFAHYLKHPNNFIEIKLISRMVENYLIQLNYLCMHGYKITNSIQQLYNHFNPNLVVPSDNAKTNPPLTTQNKYIDCETTTSAVGNFACKNGDGLILGKEENLNYSKYNVPMQYKDKKYSYVLASFLNDMFDKVRKAGIKPVLILIPQFEDSVINYALIKQTIHADIVDMNEFRIPMDDWYNGGHLNEKGRYVYSSALVKEMKRLV